MSCECASAACVSCALHVNAPAGANRPREPQVVGGEDVRGICDRNEHEPIRDEAHGQRLVAPRVLLWQKGGWRVTISGESAVQTPVETRIAEYLRGVYSPGGARAFDYEFSRRIYGRPLVIESAAIDAAQSRRNAEEAKTDV
jgi:hypothetical protein